MKKVELARSRVFPFLIWTFVLWVSRARNVVSDNDLSVTGRLWRLSFVVTFVVLALIVGVRLIRNLETYKWLMALVIWSIGFWLIRGGGILLDNEWSFGFKFVHTILMLVTFCFAALAIIKPDH